VSDSQKFVNLEAKHCKTPLVSSKQLKLSFFIGRFVGLKSADTSGRTFDWNPCTPFKLSSDQCNQGNLLVS